MWYTFRGCASSGWPFVATERWSLVLDPPRRECIWAMVDPSMAWFAQAGGFIKRTLDQERSVWGVCVVQPQLPREAQAAGIRVCARYLTGLLEPRKEQQPPLA